MKMPHIVSLALLALAAPVAAQNGREVGDGSTWIGSNGDNVRVEVRGDGGPGDTSVEIRFVDSSGASPWVPGGEGPTSTSSRPTCKDSDEAKTPGGARYKADKGKARRKAKSGKYVDMKPAKAPKPKKPKKSERFWVREGRGLSMDGHLHDQSGTGTFPMPSGTPAPWDGYFCSGGNEDVGSLPQ